MKKIRITGGARIGITNVSWPFATLMVLKDKLELKSILMGNYSFRKEDIISLESYRGLMSSGLKINHRLTNYNESIIFWTFKNPKMIIKQIQNIGFLESDSSAGARL